MSHTLFDTLDEEWKHFLKLSYPGEKLGPVQNVCLKRAFYGGVLTGLTACIQFACEKDGSQAEAKVSKLLSECLKTCEELSGLEKPEKPENN